MNEVILLSWIVCQMLLNLCFVVYAFLQNKMNKLFRDWLKNLSNK